jgi:hypothetical protein
MRRTSSVVIGCLTALTAFTFGCSSSRAPAEQEVTDEVSAGDLTASETIGIDPAELSPDALVFAAGRGGGFLMSPEQIFFVDHYGDSRLYVFGDRRVIRLDQGTIPELGYRVLRQAEVPEETLAELLALAAAVGPDDDGSYEKCPALDGPTETLYVALPGLTVTASCFSSFAGWPDCGEEPQEWETPPPDSLVALHAALVELKELPGEILATDRILFGGYLATGPGLPKNCDETNAVAWPLADFAAFPETDDYNFWSMVLDGVQATDVRDFLRTNLSGELYYPSACVSRDGQFYRVFYDDMLPGEESFPF